jgi:hypothetical protein
VGRVQRIEHIGGSDRIRHDLEVVGEVGGCCTTMFVMPGSMPLVYGTTNSS